MSVSINPWKCSISQKTETYVYMSAVKWFSNRDEKGFSCTLREKRKLERKFSRRQWNHFQRESIYDPISAIWRAFHYRLKSPLSFCFATLIFYTHIPLLLPLQFPTSYSLRIIFWYIFFFSTPPEYFHICIEFEGGFRVRSIIFRPGARAPVIFAAEKG